MVIPQVLKMVTRREAAHDGAHERVNDWQTPVDAEIAPASAAVGSPN
jgi:hypothetical protein